MWRGQKKEGRKKGRKKREGKKGGREGGREGAVGNEENMIAQIKISKHRMEDGVKEPFQGQKLKRSREMECGKEKKCEN